MGYTTEENMVRVDFFKPSGKWYTTEAVKWIGSYTGGLIHDHFRASLEAHLKGRLDGMIAVCLKPYHAHSHPLSLRVGAKVPAWEEGLK